MAEISYSSPVVVEMDRKNTVPEDIKMPSFSFRCRVWLKSR
jgi:hypothetical protein